MGSYTLRDERFLCPVHKVCLKFLNLNAGAKLVTSTESLEKLTGFLANDDETIVYPVIDGIPQLVRWEAVKGIDDSLKNEEFLVHIRKEIEIYDELLAKSLDTKVNRLSADFEILYRHWDKFPYPLDIWVDTPTSSDAQFEAYKHLCPLKGAVFLQFGGSGTHAVKMLIAGASKAYLLSPSQNEIKFGRKLASNLGLSEKFVGIRGIGEEIPLPSESIDRVYGGGCLHHTNIEKSLPEVYRVLRSGGKASFVDPKYNWLYTFLMSLTGNKRFLGKEDETLDSPIDLNILYKSINKISGRVYLSGGIVRYVLIAISRLLRRNLLNAKMTYRIFKLERFIMKKIGLSSLFNNMSILIEKP